MLCFMNLYFPRVSNLCFITTTVPGRWFHCIILESTIELMLYYICSIRTSPEWMMCYMHSIDASFSTLEVALLSEREVAEGDQNSLAAASIIGSWLQLQPTYFI